MPTFVRMPFLMIALILTGCATTAPPPPKNTTDVRAIFNEYPHWYRAAKKTQDKWGVPINVQMAIIYYESAFKGEARPPRKYYLGFIPGKHISSAYGYAQALDGTWDDYLSSASPWFASRNKFDSATDFIGWYSAKARQRLGIPSDDPYNLYLAYHEGLGGFERKSYLKKPWLMQVAKNVEAKSQLFQNQLAFDMHEQATEVNQLLTNEPTELASLPEPETESTAQYVCKPTDEDGTNI